MNSTRISAALAAIATLMRRPLAAAVIAVSLAAAGGACVAWMGARAEASARALQLARTRLAATTAELAEARALSAALASAQTRWQVLERAGALAGPALPRWSQAVDRAVRERQLSATSEVRFAAPAPRLANSGTDALPLHSSALEVRLPLRHEAHLPALLAAIEATAGAIVRTEGCQLKRIAANSSAVDSSAGARGGVFASCRLQWLSIDASTLAPPP